MAFNGIFTAAQSADGSAVTFTDLSTGSDTNLTGRRIYPYKTDATVLVPAGNTLGYIDWPLSAGSTLVVTNLLLKDYALNSTVVWISSSPLVPPSSYMQTTLYGFVRNTKNFIYNKLQDLDAKPTLNNDQGWASSLFKLHLEVKNCILAVEYFDQYKAQSALDRAYSIMQNQKFNF